MSTNPFMKMESINKSFNGVPVLNDVSLQVEYGEIHALLGENGAGKSTLMNILGGVIESDKGKISIDGNEVKMTNPRVSQKYGVSFIHQELNVVSDLRVYENMFLGFELRNKLGIVREEEMCKQTNEILATLGVDIDPKEYVRELDTSYKQLIEISKALLHKSTLIIMDEPTSALAEHEVERLFGLMKNLKGSGISVIYISHKLKEIEEVCDRYTVLRDGQVVGTGDMKEQSLDALTKLMVGKSISEERFVQDHVFGPVALEVKNLSSEGLFKNINFTVHKGEILGFTGLAGDGRTELFESLFGYRNRYTGEVKINDQIAKINHPKKALKAGVGLVPKDRKENAIIKDISVIHNMSLSSMGNFEKSGLLQGKVERKKFDYYQKMLNIKVHNPQVTIDKLSGGNQQKVVIAKWLEVNTDIIIFDNPTQGIDVGAKREIYQHIVSLAEQGKAVIILSSEAPEVRKICHRINVMYQGEVTARFNGEDATEDEIMSYATGSKKEGENIAEYTT
ncbi:ribose transport system ATP-binding protein [Virgibacillus natechei]|uniref:Ribose transport system ATP-binding protein n=1 Tax=Virgibacillus natechei TaxID=1216297 RepID=A0ABS4IGZ9_9BACI|nr:sugar ABC transporter ATP-binding protein [Virgibacillus natechei]MBP1970222.1 ribose transport system ATP-binding protein [Virgibacillus natechei]UZD12830.1 sugar ABC transporter ATP-binding protein [Virgibacillus natechei]